MRSRALVHRTTVLAGWLTCMLARTALAGPLVLQVQPSSAGDASAARPLVLARVDAAMRQARRDYTDSHFGRCVLRLRRAEDELARALREPSDWLLLKRVTHWLGLCLAVSGDTDGARAVFRRGGRLPGPPLDGSLAPPPVVRLSVEAGAGPRCSLELTGTGELGLDGAPARPGWSIEQGEHYAAWRDEGGVPRSGRASIDERCRLRVPVGQPRPDPRSLRIEPDEAADSTFLREVAIAAGARNLWLLHVSGRVQVFDLVSGTLLERDRAALGEVQATVRAPASAPSRQPLPAPPRRSWYKRWWIWTLVGVVASTAVVVPVLLTRPQRYDLSFSPTP